MTIAGSRPGLVDNGDGTWTFTQTGDESDNGTVTVTATNADGKIGRASFTVAFTDVAPTVVSLANSAVTTAENVPATNSGSFADYDDSMTIAASRPGLVDNGDGSWTFTQTGDESDNGTVTVTATNADGSSVSTSFTVAFTDVAPTVVSLASSAVTTAENVPATNSGSFADYDDSMTITASRPGVRESGDGSWTFTQTGDESDNGTVTVTAPNADGSSISTSFTVAFTDVAPTVVSLASSAVTTPENVPATNSGSFADYDDSMTITASRPGLVDKDRKSG